VALASAALVVACLIPLLGGSPQPAGAAQVTQFGQTKKTPKPACPKTPCEAVGSVTGFQTSASGGKRPFRVTKAGSIVAWSIALSRPNSKQRKFFGDFYKSSDFGTAPTARIAVIAKTKGTTYKLRRQSPVSDLTNSLSTTPIFTLKSPLKVKPGDVIALTVPTWAPGFSVGVSKTNAWRASRAHGHCTKSDDIKAGRPQTKEGKTRQYDCVYDTARLLYWAYFVKS
jgi:hypothetical protein